MSLRNGLAGRPAASGRVFADVDILIAQPLLGEAESLLTLQGWMSDKLDAYDQRYYRQWMHELPPLQHMRRSSVIDVHHAILPETAAVDGLANGELARYLGHPDRRRELDACVAARRVPTPWTLTTFARAAREGSGSW